MASKKKKQEVVEEIPVGQVQVEPANAPPAVEQGKCIQCRFLLTGSWRGPTCTQPASPNHKQRVRDEDTCDMFQPKHSQHSARLSEPTPVGPDVTTEGQYDPDPASLTELLARETEAPQDGS